MTAEYGRIASEERSSKWKISENFHTNFIYLCFQATKFWQITPVLKNSRKVFQLTVFVYSTIEIHSIFIEHLLDDREYSKWWGSKDEKDCSLLQAGGRDRHTQDLPVVIIGLSTEYELVLGLRVIQEKHQPDLLCRKIVMLKNNKEQKAMASGFLLWLDTRICQNVPPALQVPTSNVSCRTLPDSGTWWDFLPITLFIFPFS